MKKEMHRRDFLKYLFAWGSATMAPVPLFDSSLATGFGLAPRARRQTMWDGSSVWAWLRMFEVGGKYPIPTSEAAYKENLGAIDVAMPTNGGKLQGDGTWRQEPWKVHGEWPQGLPQLARDAGHLYIPMVDNDKNDMDAYLTVLDDPALHIAAADNLVALATGERFDSPWDGVILDFEATPSSHREQLADFHYVLADRIKQAGLLHGISVGGRVEDGGAHDFSIVAELADFVDLRCYGYRKPAPFSIGPYWWLEACIQFAFSEGIQPEQLLLGIGNFCAYQEDATHPSPYNRAEITYEQAMALVEAAGATVEWIEGNDNGFIREWFAQIGKGHLWLHNAGTHEYNLNLIDQYSLMGNSLFAVGMGDEDIWELINAWRFDQG
jgi:hypothetical protein